MYLATPTRISMILLEFCRGINPNDIPFYVQVVPIEGSLFNECFGNVDKKIAQKGGEKVHGWTVREWKGVFLEAEFHAIWKSPKGAFLDVTPTEEVEVKRLFLPDPGRSFEGDWVNMIRKPLRPDPVITEFFKAFDAKRHLLERHSEPGYFGYVSVPRAEAEAIDERIIQLQLELMKMRPPTPNDPCCCGSGERYKRCCGR